MQFPSQRGPFEGDLAASKCKSLVVRQSLRPRSAPDFDVDVDRFYSSCLAVNSHCISGKVGQIIIIGRANVSGTDSETLAMATWS
ncbi:hypothetical protein PAXRUDRAFT_835605 [Paxillus rubicundulus Ve08.2h10]|uniref:Uncharacterized protein n=1 Tax=Paxillus rubicundulus Ve08.2h10 TaxID=930991 RepID=A0A0D0CK66_9AGAM|nr:hypothetical protein PAXRUDRAFT_835605 [Paxillus rubicundulus Ve08.2h10]